VDVRARFLKGSNAETAENRTKRRIGFEQEGNGAATVERWNLPPSLLRLSVGIEAVEDLWADLDWALRVAVNA
jgi:cystathionine beta-lyase/cystathionine gamma-synthase